LKTIIERGLGAVATDEVMAQTMTVMLSIRRHVDMIPPRILDFNELQLEENGKRQSDDETNHQRSRRESHGGCAAR
jgi:hypothetical protein